MSSLILSGSSQGKGKPENKSIRPAAVAGTFYPEDGTELLNQLAEFFNPLCQQKRVDHVAAVIVPHAGYVFSGGVAASAFARINPEKKYDHIFLIGPSHYVAMKGASINSAFGFYQTPLGKVKVDTALCDQLIQDYPFFFYQPEAHHSEHCLEVQLPFIQVHFKHQASIVPIIIGTQSDEIVRKIAQALKPFFNEHNLFVISSDFSHYPNYAGAQEADLRTQEAIETGSPERFVHALQQNSEAKITGLVTSACGHSAILTLLYLSSQATPIAIKHLAYKNSGDSDYGTKDHVVGYHAFLCSRTQPTTPKQSTFTLSDPEKNELLKMARQSILCKLENKALPVPSSFKLTQALMKPYGAFVTLREGGQLRGCIGRFVVQEPLYETIRTMAVAAAFEDPRFPPVSQSEMKHITIEISVLSPLKRIHNIDEFSYGTQGIYIKKGRHSGTYLPQVAQETGWSKEDFLRHCSHDKAGLSWEGWLDADLYTYEAFVFEEKS